MPLSLSQSKIKVIHACHSLTNVYSIHASTYSNTQHACILVPTSDPKILKLSLRMLLLGTQVPLESMSSITTKIRMATKCKRSTMSCVQATQKRGGLCLSYTTGRSRGCCACALCHIIYKLQQEPNSLYVQCISIYT
jgi:hypothetical protein